MEAVRLFIMLLVYCPDNIHPGQGRFCCSTRFHCPHSGQYPTKRSAGIKIDTVEVLPRGQLLEYAAHLNRVVHVEPPAFAVVEAKQQGKIRLRLNRTDCAE